MDVSNLISGSSAFSKSRIYTWTFMVSWAVKSGLQLSLDLAAAAKSLQSCLTLCDPIDGSPPGSPIPGILQARTLEWVAISFSNAWKWKVKVKSLSCVRLLATPWTAAYQAPPSMGFPRQEYWSGLPLPSLGFSSYLYFQLTTNELWKCTAELQYHISLEEHTNIYWPLTSIRLYTERCIYI